MHHPIFDAPALPQGRFWSTCSRNRVGPRSSLVPSSILVGHSAVSKRGPNKRHSAWRTACPLWAKSGHHWNREWPNLHFGDEHQHSLLDSALASGLAVASAGPVSIPSRTLGHELHSSPVSRLSWRPLHSVFVTAAGFQTPCPLYPESRNMQCKIACPLRVISGHFALQSRCPRYRRRRTFVVAGRHGNLRSTRGLDHVFEA